MAQSSGIWTPRESSQGTEKSRSESCAVTPTVDPGVAWAGSKVSVEETGGFVELVVVEVDVLVVLAEVGVFDGDEELVLGPLVVVVCPALVSTPDARNGTTTRAAMSTPDDIRRSLL